jgi:hypothetical protein
VAEGFGDDIGIAVAKCGDAPYHQHSAFFTLQPFDCLSEFLPEQNTIKTDFEEDFFGVFKHGVNGLISKLKCSKLFLFRQAFYDEILKGGVDNLFPYEIQSFGSFQR